jgi:hypothetical protein
MMPDFCLFCRGHFCARQKSIARAKTDSTILSPCAKVEECGG